MLGSFFAFIHDMAWELVVMQMNPLIGAVIVGISGLVVWGAFQWMRR